MVGKVASPYIHQCGIGKMTFAVFGLRPDVKDRGFRRKGEFFLECRHPQLMIRTAGSSAAQNYPYGKENEKRRFHVSLLMNPGTQNRLRYRKALRVKGQD